MMKKNYTILICLMLALALLCCACGSSKTAEEEEPSAKTPAPTQEVVDTPADVLEKMQKALNETPCSHAEMVMEMLMSFDAGDGDTIEARTVNTSDITVCQAPISGLTVTTAETEADGENITTVTETYSLIEDDDLVSYVCSDGVWMKMTTGQTPEQFADSAACASVDADSAAFDESATEWQGKPAICITASLAGNELDEILSGILTNMEAEEGAVADAAGMLNSADYGALQCSVRIYLDPETYLPLAEEMQFEGMTEVIAPIYEDTGISVEVTACSAVATFLSYEPQAEITLPEGAAEKAEAWMRSLNGEADNGDGTFTIREGAVLADVAALEGFTTVETDYDHVYFVRDDLRQVGYSMWYVDGDTEAGDAYFGGMIDDVIPSYQELGYTVENAAMDYPAGDFEYSCRLLSVVFGDHEDAEAYAWTPLASDENGTYYIFVEIYDGYDNGDGNSKNTDLGEEDFLAYLQAVSRSWLMD